MEPNELVEGLEEQSVLPKGDSERFSGYGVMGLPFASGHVLGLRRFPASSVGPGYTSVWHRDPDGRWTFYQDVQPEQACPRYFGRDISDTFVRDIDISWTAPRSLTVTMGEGVDLHWQAFLSTTPVTRAMNALSDKVPERLWTSEGFLRAMGAVAGPALRAGRVGLTGRVPSGQSFMANPLKVWVIDSSRAILGDRDLGDPGPLEQQARLGDFWIPQRGIFAIGRALFELHDPSRHLVQTSSDEAGP